MSQNYPIRDGLSCDFPGGPVWILDFGFAIRRIGLRTFFLVTRHPSLVTDPAITDPAIFDFRSRRI
jgi:hypothetical protein